jgi:5-methylcytosine-specific restriction enzyme A
MLVAVDHQPVPADFVRGQIDLAATSEFGKGYEQGSIASKIYRRGDETTEAQLTADFVALLDAYDELFKRIGPDLAAVAPSASEDEYQEAAAVLSLEPKQKPYEPPGPVPRPPKSPHVIGSGYRRDPKVAAAALKNSAYKCATDDTHQSFIARRTKMNFVEAHHLVPMQFQEHFEPSLDVLENVVVLCPTCHRKLHHGQVADKKVLLTLLHQTRGEALKSRGLEITLNHLVALYKGNSKTNSFQLADARSLVSLASAGRPDYPLL